MMGLSIIKKHTIFMKKIMEKHAKTHVIDTFIINIFIHNLFLALTFYFSKVLTLLFCE